MATPSTPQRAARSMSMGDIRHQGPETEARAKIYWHHLQWTDWSAMTIVARERLARVLLDQGQPDEALARLDGASDISGFESRYAEVRGDIYFSQGREDEARAAYLEALDKLEAGIGDRNKLVMKLESMGAEIPGSGSES